MCAKQTCVIVFMSIESKAGGTPGFDLRDEQFLPKHKKQTLGNKHLLRDSGLSTPF
jgi:hypothetical protein